MFISFSEPKHKYNLQTKDCFWKYLQIRDCINKDQFNQDKNPVLEFLELPRKAHSTAMFYKIFSGLQKDIYKSLGIIWQKNLGCDLSDEVWLKKLSNTGKCIKEARGKFTQYRVIHKFYFTPSKPHRMGLMANNLCWKCQTEIGTIMHPIIWECKLVNPFCKKVLEYVGKWVGSTIPVSTRLYHCVFAQPHNPN